jgi:hypothetical protein
MALSFKKSSAAREKSSRWRFSTRNAVACEVGGSLSCEAPGCFSEQIGFVDVIPPVVQLIPQHYGGSGMLGLFVRFDTYLGTRDNILRVLVRIVVPCGRWPFDACAHVTLTCGFCPQEVKPSSPAQLSGLTPLVDYILAADDCVFECGCLSGCVTERHW